MLYGYPTAGEFAEMMEKARPVLQPRAAAQIALGERLWNEAGCPEGKREFFIDQVAMLARYFVRP